MNILNDYNKIKHCGNKLPNDNANTLIDKVK